MSEFDTVPLPVELLPLLLTMAHSLIRISKTLNNDDAIWDMAPVLEWLVRPEIVEAARRHQVEFVDVD